MALILVVEDDQMVRETIKAILGEEHLILEAATGEDALRQVKKVKPGLIILDINLNGGKRITGMQVCTALTTTPALSGIPILAMSGRSDAKTISETMAVGATDFLAKPFNNDELRRRVDRLLIVQVDTVARHLAGLGESDLVLAVEQAMRQGSTLKIARALRQAILDIERELSLD